VRELKVWELEVGKLRVVGEKLEGRRFAEDGKDEKKGSVWK